MNEISEYLLSEGFLTDGVISGRPISAAQFVLKYQVFQIVMLNQIGFPQFNKT